LAFAPIGTFAALWLATPAAAAIVGVAPNATFLRTDSSDPAPFTVPVALDSVGIAPGDRVRFERLGAYRYTASELLLSSAVIGLFSSSATLLENSLLNRVPGALATGFTIATPRTFATNLATDIPHDFDAGDSLVTVPAGARFLFLSTLDSLYFDNTPAPGGFAVRLTVIPTPTAAAMALLGGTVLCARRRRASSP
jgi:hypothetical protein